MPNTVSAKKRLHQTEVRTLRNKVRRTSMRTSVRKLKAAVEAGDKAAAQKALVEAYQTLDKAAQGHIVHANKAANQKRKLAALVNKMS